MAACFRSCSRLSTVSRRKLMSRSMLSRRALLSARPVCAFDFSTRRGCFPGRSLDESFEEDIWLLKAHWQLPGFANQRHEASPLAWACGIVATLDRVSPR